MFGVCIRWTWLCVGLQLLAATAYGEGRDWIVPKSVTIHEYRGRPCAIEESSDASAPRRTATPKAASTPAKAPAKSQGGETVSGSLLLSPAPSPVQTFLYWGGHWYQSDGTQWRYHSTPVTARSVPQAHPTMPVMYAQPVPVVSSSWPVGFQMGSMFIGAEIVEQVGVTNGCPPGG